MTEQELLVAIKSLAAARGWLLHHDRPARKRNGGWYTAIQGDAGFPDLVMARRGRVIFAELKRGENDGLRPDQKGWFEALRGAGPRDGVLAPFEVYLWALLEWQDGTIERLLE